MNPMTTENQGESTNQGHQKKEVHVYCIWQCNIVVVSLRVIKVLFYNIVCKIYVFPNGLLLTICYDKRGNFHFSISILITSVNIHVAIHVINLKLH